MSDEVVLVTGGTRGIGRETTELFASRGATVVANYYQDSDAAASTESACRELPGEVQTKQFDVSDQTAVADAIEAIETDVGEITILVNNAGVMHNSLLLRMDPDQWHSVLETNLSGTFYCTKEVARSMLLGDGGSIVCVSSIAGAMGWAGQANYAASKAGIVGFVQSTAREFGSRGIRVNAVEPGFTETALYEANQRDGEYFVSSEDAPLERVAEPSEIAEAIYFLASDRASFITGEVLRVDGGLLA